MDDRLDEQDKLVNETVIRMYADGAPSAEIRAATGLTKGQLDARVKRLKRQGRLMTLPRGFTQRSRNRSGKPDDEVLVYRVTESKLDREARLCLAQQRANPRPRRAWEIEPDWAML